MTPASKITCLAALLIGISVGLSFGYRNRINLLRQYADSRLEIPPFMLTEFARDEYSHADSEHARAALLTYANLLEEMGKAKLGKTLKFELSQTYTRLALLEDDERNAEQSRDDMSKAQYWYMSAGGRSVSDSEMKAAMIKFNDHLGWSRSQAGAR